MSIKQEQETIILINEADKAEGFFRFYTSHPGSKVRFLKRVPRHDLDIIKERDSEIDCRVPMRYLSSSWSIRAPRPALSESERVLRSECLRKSLGREIQN